MSVLVIVQGTPNSEKLETLKQYQRAALPVIQKHGGQVVARGNGMGKYRRASPVVAWDRPALSRYRRRHAWHSDPDYEKVIPLRNEAYAQLEINVFQE